MDLEKLILKVNEHFGCDIKQNTRVRKTVMARACYYWLALNTNKISKTEIGKSVGRDHAGVIYSLMNLDNWLLYDHFFNERFEQLKIKVLAEFKKNKINPENLLYKYNNLVIENDILKNEIKKLKELINV